MTRTGNDGGETLYAEGYFWNGWFWLFDYQHRVEGLGGNDTIHGGRWNDTIYAGDGDDWVDGSLEHDWISGGNGNDKLYGSIGNDTVYGDVGNDHIDGSFDNDKLYGGSGDDNLYGGAGDDIISGGDGNDTIEGGTALLGSDTLYGDGGNDTISGGDNNDALHGGVGNDNMTGNQGSDTLRGEAGNDTIRGGEEWLWSTDTNYLYGGDGNDYVIGSGEIADIMQGDAGNDILFAGSNQVGGTNRDTLVGGKGSDVFMLAGDLDKANKASNAQIMTTVNEGVKIAGKVVDVLTKVGGMSGVNASVVGLAFQAVSTAISLAQAFMPPKGGWNDVAWIEDFKKGEDTLVLDSQYTYQTQIMSYEDLGLNGGREVHGVGIYRGSNPNDVVAFIETGYTVGARQQAGELHDFLIANQFRTNNFKAYGMNANQQTLLNAGSEVRSLMGL